MLHSAGAGPLGVEAQEPPGKVAGEAVEVDTQG